MWPKPKVAKSGGGRRTQLAATLDVSVTDDQVQVLLQCINSSHLSSLVRQSVSWTNAICLQQVVGRPTITKASHLYFSMNSLTSFGWKC